MLVLLLLLLSVNLFNIRIHSSLFDDHDVYSHVHAWNSLHSISMSSWKKYYDDIMNEILILFMTFWKKSVQGWKLFFTFKLVFFFFFYLTFKNLLKRWMKSLWVPSLICGNDDGYEWLNIINMLLRFSLRVFSSEKCIYIFINFYRMYISLQLFQYFFHRSKLSLFSMQRLMDFGSKNIFYYNSLS